MYWNQLKKPYLNIVYYLTNWRARLSIDSSLKSLGNQTIQWESICTTFVAKVGWDSAWLSMWPIWSALRYTSASKRLGVKNNLKKRTQKWVKKWATGQSCIRKRSTTCKIGTLISITSGLDTWVTNDHKFDKDIWLGFFILCIYPSLAWAMKARKMLILAPPSGIFIGLNELGRLLN